MKQITLIFSLWMCLNASANIHRYLFPQNNFYFTTDTVSFAWNDVDSVSYYELQVSTDSTFATSTVTYSITSNSIKVPISTAGWYYWRVRAFSNYFQPWTFRRSLKKVNLSSMSPMLWLDASQINAPNNTVIGNWLDMSGSSNNGVANGTGARLINNGFGAKPALFFNANTYDFGNKFAFNGNASFAIAVKPGVLGTFYTYFAKSINAQGGWYLGNTGAGVLNVFADVEQKIGPAAPNHLDTVHSVLTGTFKNATDTAFFFRNGIPYYKYKPTSDFVGSNALQFTVGSTNNSLPLLGGYIAELILFNKCLTPEERADVDNYMLNKYAPEVSLGRDVKTCAAVYNISTSEKYRNYLWSTGDTTPTINVTTTGNYFVRTRDIFNRFSFDTVFVQFDTVDYKPKLPADTFVCKGNIFALNAGPTHYTYTWNTGETTPTKVVNNTGTYIVSVKNCKNNTYADTIVLFVSDNKPNLPDTTFYCYNSQVTLDPLLTKTSLSYLWNTSAITKTITVNTAGQYILRVTDSLSCVFRDTVWVKVDSSLKQVSLGPDNALCSGNKLSLVNSSPAITNYWWNTGDTVATTIATTAQTYWLEVTNANNCKQRDSIGITILGFAPTVKFKVSNRCEGDNTLFEDLSIPPIGNTISARVWKFTSADSSLNTNPVFNFASKGFKSINIKVTTNVGCSADTTFNLYLFAKPKANFTTGISCAKSDILFNNLTTYDPLDSESVWYWNFGDGTTANAKFVSHSFDSSKAYQVTYSVQSKNLCTDTLIRTLSIYPEIKLDFDVINSCSSDTTYFIANPISKSIVNYNWSFGNSKTGTGKNTATSYLASGNYEVILAVENAIGCIDTVRKNIDIVSKPVVGIVSDKGCLGKRFGFADNCMISAKDSIVLYQWIVANKDTLLGKNPIYYFKDTGKFSVQLLVKTKLGCSNTATKTVNIGFTPTAKFYSTGVIGNLPVNLVFHNSSSNATLYKWTIAGKDTFSDTVVNYQFSSFGKYKIQLLAWNDAGCSDEYSNEIEFGATNLDVMLDKLTISEFVDNDKNSLFAFSVRVSNVSSRFIKSIEFFVTDGTGTKYQESWNGNLEPGKSEIIVLKTKPLYTPEIKRTFFCTEAVMVNGGETEKTTSNNKVCNFVGPGIVCQIFPVPVKDEMKVSFTASEEKTLKVSIFNSKGKEIVRDDEFKLIKGLNVFKWNAGSWERDVYIMKVKESDFEQVIKFVLD